jgi:3'-phosphoadenosine 5'-phosphosulfate sulfotransferase (PAPS reductase)/FAD synthetase
MSKSDLIKPKQSHKTDLLDLQKFSLAGKIAHTSLKIKEFYEFFDGKVYISFSGGKDSTVLLDIARKIYPKIPAVFIDTGLEYPEIVDFVRSTENVLFIKPKMSFFEVIKKHGYPVISKEQSLYIYQIKNSKSEKLIDMRLNGVSHYRDKKRFKLSEKWKYLLDAPFKISDKCCSELKLKPVSYYEKKHSCHPIIGTMATDSSHRKQKYMQNGCNIFDGKRPISKPLSIWNESDIWDYIRKFEIPYSKVYDMGYDRTGCMFCLYGCHMEKNDRFEIMKKTHPRLFDYCMNVLKISDVLKWYPKMRL